MRIEKSKINRILVRSPNWIGDVVMSIPAIENLKYNCPSAWLTVVAKPWVKAEDVWQELAKLRKKVEQ